MFTNPRKGYILFLWCQVKSSRNVSRMLTQRVREDEYGLRLWQEKIFLSAFSSTYNNADIHTKKKPINIKFYAFPQSKKVFRYFDTLINIVCEERFIDFFLIKEIILTITKYQSNIGVHN